jgi:hypothetical protein
VIANKSIENVAGLKYFGTAPTYQNYVHEGIKNRQNAWYHSVQSLLSSHLISNNEN